MFIQAAVSSFVSQLLRPTKVLRNKFVIHLESGGDLIASQGRMEVDRKARLHNQSRLRQLAQEHGKDVELFCAHDPIDISNHNRILGLSAS